MSVPLRAGVIELLVRTGVEIYRGMSVPLRTGVEKYDISYWQHASESRNSEVEF